MKIRRLHLYLYFYILFLGVLGMFWRSSYRSDQRLQEIYAKPDSGTVPLSLESATAELRESLRTQRDLVTVVHQMHGLNTQIVAFAVLLTLPIIFLATRPAKKLPNQSSHPTPEDGRG